MKYKYLLISLCLIVIIGLLENLSFIFGSATNIFAFIIIGYILGNWASMKDDQEGNQ